MARLKNKLEILLVNSNYYELGLKQIQRKHTQNWLFEYNRNYIIQTKFILIDYEITKSFSIQQDYLKSNQLHSRLYKQQYSDICQKLPRKSITYQNYSILQQAQPSKKRFINLKEISVDKEVPLNEQEKETQQVIVTNLLDKYYQLLVRHDRPQRFLPTDQFPEIFFESIFDHNGQMHEKIFPSNYQQQQIDVKLVNQLSDDLFHNFSLVNSLQAPYILYSLFRLKAYRASTLGYLLSLLLKKEFMHQSDLYQISKAMLAISLLLKETGSEQYNTLLSKLTSQGIDLKELVLHLQKLFKNKLEYFASTSEKNQQINKQQFQAFCYYLQAIYNIPKQIYINQELACEVNQYPLLDKLRYDSKTGPTLIQAAEYHRILYFVRPKLQLERSQEPLNSQYEYVYRICFSNIIEAENVDPQKIIWSCLCALQVIQFVEYKQKQHELQFKQTIQMIVDHFQDTQIINHMKPEQIEILAHYMEKFYSKIQEQKLGMQWKQFISRLGSMYMEKTGFGSLKDLHIVLKKELQIKNSYMVKQNYTKIMQQFKYCVDQFFIQPQYLKRDLILLAGVQRSLYEFHIYSNYFIEQMMTQSPLKYKQILQLMDNNITELLVIATIFGRHERMMKALLSDLLEQVYFRTIFLQTCPLSLFSRIRTIELLLLKEPDKAFQRMNMDNQMYQGFRNILSDFLQRQANVVHSVFQMRVSRYLMQLGYEHQVEPLLDQTLQPDIVAISRTNSKQLIVIETDGPYHYLEGTKLTTYVTLTRNSLILALGHKILVIQKEFLNLTEIHKLAYLKEKLHKLETSIQ